MSALLDVDGLYAGYGGAAVVHGLSLTVAAGELVALLGPNGAGKTTTLLTVSGLLAPIRGAVLVGGEAVDSRRPHLIARRGLAHVPEGRSLFFDLTVRENLRLTRASQEDLATTLAYFPALEPLMGRRAGLLSGGEQQMLALAVALARRPKLLMVDEMSLGLGPLIVTRLAHVLRRVADETGTGILLVEQQVHMALEVADSAYVLAHGHLRLQGPAADLAGRSDLLASSYLGEEAL